MTHLKFIALLILAFSLTNCEKKDELVNRTTDAQIVGFVLEKCYCCWGWVIKIGTDTIKTENIPNLNLSESTVFPIDAKITIGSKTVICSGKMADYYEIKKITLIK
ncbi:MAG: hypothetical protein ABSF81_18160 [Bacteroidales bacterium]